MRKLLAVVMDDRWVTYVVWVIAFLLPWNKLFISPIILLAFVLTCISFYRGGVISNLKVMFTAYRWPVLFFLIYLLSVFNSVNSIEAWHNLETKLSFVAFPFIFSALSHNHFGSGDAQRQIMKVFVLGCLSYGVYCIVFAAYSYLTHQTINHLGQHIYLGNNYFYYTYLSRSLHPSYFSLYLNIAVVLLFLFLEWRVWNRKWIFILMFFKIILILLLSSKAGWIGLFCVLTFFSVKLAINYKSLIYVSPWLFLLLGFYVFNVLLPPDFSKRVVAVKQVGDMLDQGKDSLSTGTNGMSSRVLVWQASIELIKENPIFGVGCGDTMMVLFEEYKKRGMINEIHESLNSHNQFLQTYIAAGILGLIILAAIFISAIGIAFRDGDLLKILFILLYGFNNLFESMFETQAGVICFCFFYAFLFRSFDKRKSTMTEAWA